MRHIPTLILALAPLLAAATTDSPTKVVRITLAEAVTRAREANPATLMAQARIDAAEALYEQASASGSPTVYVAGGYEATNYGGAAFGHILNQRAFSPTIDFNNVGTTDNLGVALGARYMLYDGGRTRASKRAAEAGARAARRRADGTELDLSARAAELWFANAAAGRFIEAARAQVAALEGSVDQAKARVEAGALLRADRLMLEVRLARAREALVNAEAARQLAARALLTLLDREGESVETVAGAPGPAIPDPVATDITAHPLVAAMRERILAAEGAEDAAKSGRLPRVMLQGEYGYNHGFDTGQAAPGFAAGVRVEYDLFDGDLVSGRVGEARARRREAEAALRAAELEVRRMADEARIGAERARAALRVTEHAVAAAEESARVTRERFAAGSATALQVADAEAALLETRAGRIRAETAERASVVNWRTALGLTPVPEISTAHPTARP